MHLAKRIAGPAAIAILLVLALEATSWAVVRFVVEPRAPFLLYRPPSVDAKALARYLAIRDPLLGWPRRDQIGTERYDATGARPSPAFPLPGRACLSLYGDSFTYDEHVDNAHAWSNLLAGGLGCRVANYGVSGYDTGQALLRFRQNERDEATFTILGIYHENFLRIVNQYRYLLTGEGPLQFKPRFVLEADRATLRLVEMPTDSQLAALGADWEAVLTLLRDETFPPGTADGPTALRFPYAWTLARAATSRRTLLWLAGRPSWSDFLRPGHPSHSLELMAAIVREFDRLARERGKAMAVLLFPTAPAFDLLHQTGEDVTAPLKHLIEAADIPVLDLAEALPALLDEGGFCAIHLDPALCRGHWNEKGSAMVAAIVQEWIAGRVRWRAPDSSP